MTTYKHRILSIVLTLLLIFSCVPAMALANEEPPIIPEGYTPIYTKEDLNNIRNDLSGNYILMNDIEFTEEDFAEGGDFYNDGQGWIPIGTQSEKFSGKFDGNNYAITELFQNTSNVYSGLFGVVNGSVCNVEVVFSNLNIKPVGRELDYYSGVIAGYVVGKGIIDNCISDGKISAFSGSSYVYLGGIAGYVSGEIINCINYADLNCNRSSATPTVGGIAGLCTGRIVECANYGSVVSCGETGGVVGLLRYGNIVKSYNMGLIEGSFSAGIVAVAYSSNIKDVFNRGGVVGEETGGVVTSLEWNSSLICAYNAGKLEGISISEDNICDMRDSNCTIKDCYFLDKSDSNVTDNEEIQALTLDEMMKQESFVGFDFIENWWFDINDDYVLPKLVTKRNLSIGHDIIIDNMVSPTCVSDGMSEGSHCFICGKVFKVQEVIEATGHEYVEEVIAPTCEDKGYTTCLCVCGDYYIKDERNSIGHNYGDWSVDKLPTCIENGSKSKVCNLCGNKETEEIISEGHLWNTEYTVDEEATCTKNGSKSIHCVNCRQVKDVTVIEKIAHKWDDKLILRNASCTKTGMLEERCTKCGNARNVEIPMKGHDFESEVQLPTCTNAGYTIYTCKNDKSHTYKDDYVDAIGHEYGEYKTTTKAGFNKKGTQTAYCINENCTSEITKPIPALKTPTLSTSAYTFNNKAKKPTVTVKNTEGTTISKSVSYASGRKNVGKYSVKVSVNTADYEGSKTVYFKINPKGASNVKLSKGKKAFTVKWSKPTSTYRKQMTGYQIKYSTSSKMSNAKTVTVKSTTATNKTIKKLKAKKKYYVQVRTYKKIGSIYYYSGWSSKKYVTTK